MKKHRWVDTLKELLKELSAILLIILFLSIVLLVIYLLPREFLKALPFEVLCAIGVIAILGFLYAISGIVMAIQKIAARKKQIKKEED